MLDINRLPPCSVPPPAKGATEENSLPTNDEIRMRAFQIYLDRGATDGADVDDWLQVERELQERSNEEQRSEPQNQ